RAEDVVAGRAVERPGAHEQGRALLPPTGGARPAVLGLGRRWLPPLEQLPDRDGRLLGPGLHQGVAVAALVEAPQLPEPEVDDQATEARAVVRPHPRPSPAQALPQGRRGPPPARRSRHATWAARSRRGSVASRVSPAPGRAARAS